MKASTAWRLIAAVLILLLGVKIGQTWPVIGRPSGRAHAEQPMQCRADANCAVAYPDGTECANFPDRTHGWECRE